MRKRVFTWIVGSAMIVCMDVEAGTNQVKAEILALAESYQGQGDPDRSKQRSLERLVERLLIENPQPPVRERLSLLAGAWKQVWGPYEYRREGRGVNPKLDPENIIQVVFPDGFYYNVNPNLDRHGKVTKTVLLRGEYRLDDEHENVLTVAFTDLRKIRGLPPTHLRLQDLPLLSENGRLEGETTSLPGFLVRLFFGGGALREVYTDEDLRITFGSGRNDLVDNSIYILRRLPL